MRWIYLGVVAGLAASGVIAAVFMALFGGSGPQQEIMEGVCALVAMGMLLYTSNWMLNKSSVDAWNRYIRAKTEAAVARIGGTAGTDPTPERLGAAGIVSLALLSFLAVFREGAETVIFYQSIYSMTQDAGGMWIGGITAAVHREPADADPRRDPRRRADCGNRSLPGHRRTVASDIRKPRFRRREG